MQSLKNFNVHLIPNHLTANPQDMRANIVQPVPTRTTDDLVNSIMGKRTDYEKTVVAGIIELAGECISEYILSGISYQDANFRYSPAVRGPWEGASAVFDPDKNKVDVNVTPTAAFRKELETVHVNVLGERHSPSFISKVTDMSDHPLPDGMVPGEDLRITGKHLKITPEGDPTLGVFFTSTTGQVYPVTHRMIHNKPSQLIVRVPDSLPEDEYMLTVVTRGSVNHIRKLKEPRVITFERPIRVGSGARASVEK
jgi:hypothetical protein